MTVSTLSSRSCLSHRVAAQRTARSAASLTMLASSAPDAPEVARAMALKSTLVGHFDVRGMYLQNGDAAVQVGQLHRNAAVETARAQQRGIQRFGAVGRSQNDHALAPVEAVHLGQQLVQRLLALVVAAHTAVVALLADGVDLVDKHDARRLFIGLLEQVAHLGRAHADEHLHEFRTGNGEEGNLGLAGHRPWPEGSCPFREGPPAARPWGVSRQSGVLLRLVQEVHDFHQRVLGLFLAGHILEGHARLVLGHDFGVGLAEAHGVRAGNAAALLHLNHQDAAQQAEQENGADPCNDEVQQRRILRGNDRREFHPRVLQTLAQVVVREGSGLADVLLAFVVLGHEDDLLAVLLQLDLDHLARVHHLQEVAVADLFDLTLENGGKDQRVEQHHYDGHDGAVVNQRLFAGLIRLYHDGFLAFRLVVK